MIRVKLTIPPEVEDFLQGLSDADIEAILLEAAEGYCGPGGVLEQHWERGQSAWGDPGEQYQNRKERVYGSDEKFVKSGAAKAAISGGDSPYLQKKVFKVAGGHRIEVALVRIEGGRNIYSIAQAGGKNNAGPPMRITQALPGDDEIVAPYVEASFRRHLKQKGIL